MNDPEQVHLLRSAVTLQAIPDGADNLHGLLTALLRSTASELPCADDRSELVRGQEQIAVRGCAPRGSSCATGAIGLD